VSADISDPREIEHHPRRRTTLVGHADAERRLLQNFRSGRMHHGWLFTGPKGIGKATLAYRLARFILARRDEVTATSLFVPGEAPVARRIAAAGHPDLFVLERVWDAEKERLKTEIAVDDAREAIGFFERTAAEGGWRVLIVDAADDLNRESANALLKTLEEPPPRALVILIAHRPGGLLRTIRSRCVTLPLLPLSEADTLEVMRGLTGTAGEDLVHAAQLAHGSPGRALALLGSTGANLFRKFTGLCAQANAVDMAGRIQVAEGLAARNAGDAFDVFGELLIGWSGKLAREAALGGRPAAALAQAHDEIALSFRRADALNLDRRQTAIEAMAAIEAALKQ
jgi:DNA polymerase-3 subunit delta'